jgi:hypothetical protein
MLRNAFFSSHYYQQRRSISSATHQIIQSLRKSFDRDVIGQEMVKHGFMLAYLSKEHMYIHGPTGSSKTFLTSKMINSLGKKSKPTWFCSLHRDSRADEFLGPSLIQRRKWNSTEKTIATTEVLQQSRQNGGMLNCELAVIDNITSAPSESLSILMRILSERKYLNHALKLKTCIGIGSSTGSSSDVVIDSAMLDRFAIQVETSNLLQMKDWESASKVIETDFSKTNTNNMDGIEIELSKAVDSVPHIYFHKSSKEALLRLLQILQKICSVPLYSDRTFLVKATRIMQAEAVFNGRKSCIPNDLYAIKYMTRFRVPVEVHRMMDDIITDILSEMKKEEEKKEEEKEKKEKGDNNSSSDTTKLDGHHKNSKEEDDTTGSDTSESNNSLSDESKEEEQDNTNSFTGMNNNGYSNNDNNCAERDDKSNSNNNTNGAAIILLNNNENDCVTNGDVLPVDAMSGKGGEHDREEQEKGKNRKQLLQNNKIKIKLETLERKRKQIVNLKPILERLRGHFQNGISTDKIDSSGSPKDWKIPSTMEDLFDSDSIDLSLWVENPIPLLPRVRKRMKKSSNGQLIICRDISLSMRGEWNRWTSLLCENIVLQASILKMNIGYIEFNSYGTKFTSTNDNFFTNNYKLLSSYIQSTKCSGLTNYEEPLKMSMDEFNNIKSSSHMNHYQIKKWNRLTNKDAKKILNNSKIHSDPGYGYSTSEAVNQLNKRSTNKSSSTSSISPSVKLLTDQHILFITDGQPTIGDQYVKNELYQARKLGISIHTLFIGYEDAPVVLNNMSNVTGGSKFAAYFDVNNDTINCFDRDLNKINDFIPLRDLRKLKHMNRMGKIFNLKY